MGQAITEGTIQEIFGEVQPGKVEDSKKIENLFQVLVVPIIKIRLDEVKDARGLLSFLGTELETALATFLCLLPLEKQEESLDKMFDAMRKDIRRLIEIGRGM